MVKFTVNGQSHSLDIEPETPLLWVLRDNLDLKGAKYGCGIGLCGSCTVHLDGRAVRACVIPVSAVDGRSVTTIEGIDGDEGRIVQQAWEELDVPQCGYCQPGMIMTVVDLLRGNAAPSDADIDNAVTNICRCGTYPRIRRAIHLAASRLGGSAHG